MSKKNYIQKIKRSPNEADFSPKKIKEFSAKNERQSEGYIQCESNRIIFLLGKVGAGKTYLGIHYALKQYTSGNVDKIVVLRPTVATDEDLGYLKGDMVDKIGPYLASMTNIIDELIGRSTYDKMVEDEVIQLDAIGFQRGLTHKNAIVLVDEIQNMTRNQLRLILTRIGKGSKIILMGDGTQRDLDEGIPSAIDDLERFIGKKNIAFTIFRKGDAVRDVLTRIVESCYDDGDMVTDMDRYGHLVYPDEVQEREYPTYNNNRY